MLAGSPQGCADQDEKLPLASGSAPITQRLTAMRTNRDLITNIGRSDKGRYLHALSAAGASISRQPCGVQRTIGAAGEG